MLEKARKRAKLRKYFRIRPDGKIEFSYTKDEERGFTGLTERIRHMLPNDYGRSRGDLLTPLFENKKKKDHE